MADHMSRSQIRERKKAKAAAAQEWLQTEYQALKMVCRMHRVDPGLAAFEAQPLNVMYSHRKVVELWVDALIAGRATPRLPLGQRLKWWGWSNYKPLKASTAFPIN